MTHNKNWLAFALAAAITVLAGCATTTDQVGDEAYSDLGKVVRGQDVEPAPMDPGRDAALAEQEDIVRDDLAAMSQQQTEIEMGSGSFVNREAATRPVTPPPADGEVTLNFPGTEVTEVVHVVLNDMLGENYLIEGGVGGQVNFSTSRPVGRDDLLPILEMLLAMNNAALVYTNGMYKVTPVANAIPGQLAPRLRAATRNGYQVRLIPLRYISASEMQIVLTPYMRPSAIVSADNQRNILVLAGTPQELDSYMQTIETFDVDWLEGMSVGIFPIQQVEVDQIVTELDAVFGPSSDTPMAGMFRFMPLERLNSVLVITTQPTYLDKAEEWLGRLDRSTGGAGLRLYVYMVRNVKAVELAETLSEVFAGGDSGGSQSSSSRRTSTVAPGLEPVTVTSLNDPRQRRQQDREERDLTANERPQPLSAADPLGAGRSSAGAVDPYGGLAIVESEDISITAVEESNALLIRSTPPQYEAILAAIERLDIVPLQVHIEATILEVGLSDALEYGVQWFFNSNPAVANPAKAGDGTGFLGSPGPDPATFGFNWLSAGGDINLVVSALARETQVDVLSSPSLVVLNNKEAQINVGDQIPVTTTFFQPGAGSGIGGAPTTTGSVQFRDTGVILNVVPRVNPGGLVFMEISQEVSQPGDVDPFSGNREIQRRTINTEIAIQSGETIIMGGLIQEQTTVARAGVPGLSAIPVIGNLFGSRKNEVQRNELVLMLTPTVIASSEEARRVSEEYTKKFRGLKPLPVRRPQFADTPPSNPPPDGP